MATWVATAFGALDMRESVGVDADYVILPTVPSEPFGISGDVAALWGRLVDGPVDDSDLTEAERELVREFAEFGIASADAAASARVTTVPTPWLSSFLHELVYALVASVAREEGIDAVFIKGPVLHAQGLREREHSGDVDVWVQPDQVGALVAATSQWGWSLVPDPWEGTPINHSTTVAPSGWGCEIDIHRHFPGVGLEEAAAFAAVLADTATVHFAGVTAAAPSIGTHAVLAALHRARPSIGAHLSTESAHVAEAVLVRGGAPAAAAVENLRAAVCLGAISTRAFPDVEFSMNYPVPINWAWRERPDRLAGYLAALRMMPWWQRPRVLWHLMWPASPLALASDRAAGGTASGAVDARLRRLGRALAPAALRGRK